MESSTAYLDWSVSLWLFDAQVDEAGHRQTDIKPVTEAEVVNEQEHILHTQENQTHEPLKPQLENIQMSFFFFSILIRYSFVRMQHGGVLLTLNSSAGTGV